MQGAPPPSPRPIANPVFEQLSLEFTFPLFCTCVANQNCRAKKYKLKIEYDGTSHPIASVAVSEEDDCPNYFALRPTTDLAPSPKNLLNNKVTYVFTNGVTCDCGQDDEDADDDTGEGKGDEKGTTPVPEKEPDEEAEQDECPLEITIEYTFTTTLP